MKNKRKSGWKKLNILSKKNRCYISKIMCIKTMFIHTKWKSITVSYYQSITEYRQRRETISDFLIMDAYRFFSIILV